MTDPKQDVRQQFEAWWKSLPPIDSEFPETMSDKELAYHGYQAALQSPAVRELVEALTGSIAEIERLRDAMFRVYSTAANGGKTTKVIEAMRDEMDKPWSVDRSRTALRTLGAGHVE